MAKRPLIGNLWYNEDFFGNLFDRDTILVKSIEDLNKIDLLVFWGGTDIGTHLYGEPNCKSGAPDTARDKFELLMFTEAKGKLPMVGICRGAQFLCAVNGGRLWQHVDGHGRDHNIKLNDGMIVPVTSTHHQMMRATYEMDVLAECDRMLSPTKYDHIGPLQTHVTHAEAEIIYSKAGNSLMIQGHPEYSHADSRFVQLTKDLVTKYLGVK